jgi:hypothetical protein
MKISQRLKDKLKTLDGLIFQQFSVKLIGFMPHLKKNNASRFMEIGSLTQKIYPLFQVIQPTLCAKEKEKQR